MELWTIQRALLPVPVKLHTFNVVRLTMNVPLMDFARHLGMAILIGTGEDHVLIRYGLHQIALIIVIRALQVGTRFKSIL